MRALTLHSEMYTAHFDKHNKNAEKHPDEFAPGCFSAFHRFAALEILHDVPGLRTLRGLKKVVEKYIIKYK